MQASGGVEPCVHSQSGRLISASARTARCFSAFLTKMSPGATATISNALYLYDASLAPVDREPHRPLQQVAVVVAKRTTRPGVEGQRLSSFLTILLRPFQAPHDASPSTAHMGIPQRRELLRLRLHHTEGVPGPERY